MIPLVFHVGSNICFFTNTFEVFTAIDKHFALELYTHVHIQNTNVHKVLS